MTPSFLFTSLLHQEPMLDPSFTGLGMVADSPSGPSDAATASGGCGGAQVSQQIRTSWDSSSRGFRAGGGTSGCSLSARMQRLLNQQRANQEKLSALVAAGTLSQHVLQPWPLANRTASSTPPARAGQLGGRGAGEGVLVAGGPRLPIDVSPIAMDYAAGPDGLVDEPMRDPVVPVVPEQQGPARCLEMCVTGPCSWEGHLVVCQVNMRRLSTPTDRSITDGLSATAGFAVLQSKGLPQGLALVPGIMFTVHRPWHEISVSDLSAPIILAFCLTAGHVFA